MNGQTAVEVRKEATLCMCKSLGADADRLCRC